MDPVAVIGGGVIGTAVTRALAERDVPVTLSERDALGGGDHRDVHGHLLLAPGRPGRARTPSP
ncbi:MAG: FAD-dependent oxidoreductase [Halodesulfurarchaeum sp.]